jgi:guanylate kinase
MTNFGQGMMIVLSSPSGAGKTTLTRMLSEKNDNFIISISHTTRIPRNNEVNGKDYFFVDKKEFQELIKNNCFIEHATVFNNLYGTMKEPVIKDLSKGKNVLFDIDWQGAEQIKKKKLDFKLITLFILPPSSKELKERLHNREKRDDVMIDERMSQFKNDILHWKDYDYVVINNELSDCYNQIQKIILSESKGLKCNYDGKKIEEKVIELIS